MRMTTKLRTLLHDANTALVAGVNDAVGAVLAERLGYDALWASGLGISTAWGEPDVGLLTMNEVLQASVLIARHRTIPVISDCDTGFGGVANTARMVREFEAAGIASVCIEDKVFPKRNSFLDGGQCLADPFDFAARISAAAESREGRDFTIIARVEALIAGLGTSEAIRRATVYADAGADAILIHSKEPDPGQIIEFASVWKKRRARVPLVVVPTTYPKITLDTLQSLEIAAVVYANQALRASIQAMEWALSLIKEKGSSAELESSIATVRDIFNLTDTALVEEACQRHALLVSQLRQQFEG
jgi:phosphoenolpyruvate phosphomutase